MTKDQLEQQLAVEQARAEKISALYVLFLLSQVVSCVILAAWSGSALDPVFTLVGAGLTGLWSAELAELAGY